MQPQTVGSLLAYARLMHPTLSAEVPLVAYPSGATWTVWTRSQTTFTLRTLVQYQGLHPLEYALHSGRIGGASRLAAAGLQPAVIQRGGRWRSGAFVTTFEPTSKTREQYPKLWQKKMYSP
ncbi:unnamed protein product, partial [Sphacelaria rigidula]